MAQSSVPSQTEIPRKNHDDSSASKFLPRWDRPEPESRLPRRFVKFAIVGIGGVLVNVVSFVLVVRFTGWRDWRASGIATLVAIFNNYAFNNVWTFRDRMKKGIHNIQGYLIFMAVSGLGLAITAAVYSFLTSIYVHVRNGIPDLAHAPTLTLIACQLAGIGCATLSNFYLNCKFTWAKSAALIPEK